MKNKNPNGPYPGRQIFIGTTGTGKPCFAYLVTGRSPGSRERKAKKTGNIIRIMPSDSTTPFDPLRHYIAVKYDDSIGLAVITNGIQTEAIFEAYRLSINLKGQKIATNPELLHNLLEHAEAEPDSYHTPRIAAVIAYGGGIGVPQAVIGTIGIEHEKTEEFYFHSEHKETLSVVSTYVGDMDNPKPNVWNSHLFGYECPAKTPKELAKHIFEISAAKYEGKDIRVCAVAGVFSNDRWYTSIINAIK
ncbi:MAG: IMP cyclohydrolase [Patescibacteria group bacterium]|jgi:IMP cyclohydrolase